MKISKERLKIMVIMNIVDNCSRSKLGDEEIYTMNPDQFKSVVDTLVSNINNMQRSNFTLIQLFCHSCKKWTEHNSIDEIRTICSNCEENKSETQIEVV